MNPWLVLTGSLPAGSSALRVRIWRSLKATGCASLRDGVYLLPASAPTAAAFWAIEGALREAGSEAHMLAVKARDAVQEAEFTSLFDRAVQYAEFAQTLKEARKGMKSAGEAELRKTLRSLAARLRSIGEHDFLPGAAGDRASAGLDALRREIELRLSPGEPAPAAGAIERFSIEAVRGKPWVTRRRPWVDRLATAWLVRRFIDPQARFVWLAGSRKAPADAIGFDFDGATFSHSGDFVTFEVVARAFGLTGDAALQRVGEIVHFIDIGGIAVDEAAGVEAVVRGLHACHAGDDDLLAAALPVFDALHAAMQAAAS